MATPKIQIDNSKLLKRMKRYEEVTGKEIGASLRRGARLLAVNLAYSAPPYGKDIAARKLGERAVQNDILRVMRPMERISLPFKSNTESFKATIQRFVTKNKALRKDLLKAIRDFDMATFSSILRNVQGFASLRVIDVPSERLHKMVRNEYGRVRRGWEGREIVFKSGYLEEYIRKKQALVGFTKAAWASCAISVKADVADALSGLPTWVKRHVGKVPHNVLDASDALAPRITLTNKLPWADKALRPADHKEAIRISREKFYRSMGTEIRMALKKARDESG
jgi:hypothetical protein